MSSKCSVFAACGDSKHINTQNYSINEEFRFSVSINSMGKENYELIRRDFDFDKVMSNLQFFREICSEKETFLGITMCPMRNNWQELPEFIKLCNKLKADTRFNVVYAQTEFALWTLDSTSSKEIFDTLSANSLPGNFDLERKNRTQPLTDLFSEELFLKAFEYETKDSIEENINAILGN